MRSGLVPRSISEATRATNDIVLPLPAPATTRSGPSPWRTAAPCSGFRSSNTRSKDSREEGPNRGPAFLEPEGLRVHASGTTWEDAAHGRS